MDSTVNALIKGLNNLGQAFSSHAAGMLLQSAALIGILLIVNFILRKRVKAVWRYCLWMLLFIKLVLPPSLASPTAIAWWLTDYQPTSTFLWHKPVESVDTAPIAAPPQNSLIESTAISSETADHDRPVLAAGANLTPAKPAFEPVGWQAMLFLGWIAGVGVLSVMVWRRIRFVKRLLGQAKEADERILDILNTCRRTLGIKRRVELKLSGEIASPSVCGLFRPTILLPKHIAAKFTARKLGPILIHELAHVKRCDIFVNLVQTVLQIVYFYNPLLWLANAIVRRIREQAVDETVLVALGSEADTYSNTLIDIAEMGLWRPNPGLRLIGVVESEKTLAQRIEHIVSRPIPKSTRIGAVGLAALVIGALALLPMAKAQKDAVLNVAADGSAEYKSIQAAIDAASPGGTIKIAAGVYEEHLTINKPLTLEGAAWDKTTIMTTNRAADAIDEIMQKAMQRYQAAKTDDERRAIQAEFKAKYSSQFAFDLAPPVLSVTGAEGVIIRNIKFTSPGRVIEGRTVPLPVVKFSRARAKLIDCAVLDSPGDGIHILDGSDVEVRNCLVAALWSTGIAVSKGEAESSTARIIDSEIRNCHHRCITIGPGADSTVVKRCRISGSAWHGIRYDHASPTITDNLIFGNARSGIYASGNTAATVKNNVFFANQMTGMSCWFRNGDAIEGNTFIGNERSGLEILGKSKPAVHRTIFSANPIGISRGNIGSDSPDAKLDGRVTLEHNVFWNNGQNITRPRPKTDDSESTTENMPLDEKRGNIEKDPLYTDLLRKDFSLKSDSPARRAGIGAADPITLFGPWPMQPEEIAIVPDGDSRDSRKWKIPVQTTKAAKDSTESKEIKPTPARKSGLQKAIDAAEEGATVIVAKGIQTEPITITKSLTLKGASRTDSVFEVTANQPAIFIDTKGKGEVTIENLTVKWQLATSDKCETPFAVAVKDSKANVKNCTFLPLGNFKRCPVAISSMGFSALSVESCTFEGFEYTVSFGAGTEGTIQNCFVANSGHQGISLYSGAKVKIFSNIVTGSRYHGIRNTGGTVDIKDNLIINNANRGIYLGNRSAAGVVKNNIIIGNATGISGFARTRVEIQNNIIADSTYAGISMRDSCSLTIRDNIIKGNQRGLIVHEEGVKGANKIEINTFWQNKTDTENLEKPADSIDADPLFAAPDTGDFSLKQGQAEEQKQGLTNPDIFTTLWKQFKNHESKK